MGELVEAREWGDRFKIQGLQLPRTNLCDDIGQTGNLSPDRVIRKLLANNRWFWGSQRKRRNAASCGLGLRESLSPARENLGLGWCFRTQLLQIGNDHRRLDNFVSNRFRVPHSAT